MKNNYFRNILAALATLAVGTAGTAGCATGRPDTKSPSIDSKVGGSPPGIVRNIPTQYGNFQFLAPNGENVGVGVRYYAPEQGYNKK